MKSWAFLYGFYILAISMWPCNDAYARSTGSKLAVVASGTHHHKAAANDVCSPLCSCHCCNTAASPAFQCVKFSTATPLVKINKFPVWQFAAAAGYYGTIWQPPRLLPGIYTIAPKAAALQ
ncbi:DUF6660 family protein [Niabella sp.]|uniref:DUF6660 family protein n=1 Tax=Niabella sp. TaxID=1962976 RepID=UPI002632862E|nr:DUF6660 family protein [Niabella sp.]